MSTTELIDKNTDKRAVSLQVPRTVADLAALIVRHKDRILDALPRGVDGEAIIKKAIFLVRRQTQLLNCTPASLFYAISEAVQNGLEIGGPRAHAYLVPYGTECTLLIGYKGLIDLVRRSGELKNITVNVVHAGDVFEYESGDDERLRHVPSLSTDREKQVVTHVYAIFRLKDGSIQRNVWTSSMVNDHRERYSEAYKRGERYRLECERKNQDPDPKKLSPWHTSWRAMAIKTVVRDVVNRGLLPMSESYREIVDRDRYFDEHQKPASRESTELDRLLSSAMSDKTSAPPESRSRLESPPEAVAPDRVDDVPASLELVLEGGELDGVDPMEIDLAAARSLGDVTACREKYLDKCTTDDDREFVVASCRMREDEIRAARGARA